MNAELPSSCLRVKWKIWLLAQSFLLGVFPSCYPVWIFDSDNKTLEA